MKAEYKRDLQNNYLIFEAEEEREEEGYCVRMVEQNRVPGLLPFHSTRKDGVLYLHYEITGKQTMESMFEKQFLSHRDLLAVLTGLCGILDALQKYLLPPERLILDPQYIYLDPEGKKLWLCYAPGIENDAPITVLAEFILKRLDHKDPLAVTLGYRFYQKTQEENFSLQKSLKEILPETAENIEGPGTGQEEAYHVIHRERRGKQQAQDGWEEPEGKYTDAGWRTEDKRSSRDRKGGRMGASGNSGSGESGYTGTPGAPGFKKSGYTGTPGASGFKKSGDTGTSGNHRFGGEKSGDGVGSRQYGKEEYEEEPGFRRYGKEGYDGAPEKKKGFSEQLFQKIHPAVLLSSLFLFAALEIVFYLGYIRTTEAGGAFFLILSAEILANNCWKRAKEKKEKAGMGRWVEEEEESEEFEALQEEMYDRQGHPYAPGTGSPGDPYTSEAGRSGLAHDSKTGRRGYPYEEEAGRQDRSRAAAGGSGRFHETETGRSGRSREMETDERGLLYEAEAGRYGNVYRKEAPGEGKSFGRSDTRDWRRGYGEEDYNRMHGYGEEDYDRRHGYGEKDRDRRHGYGEKDLVRMDGYGEEDHDRMDGYGEEDHDRMHGYGEKDLEWMRGYGEAEDDPVGETRCLTDLEPRQEMKLIYSPVQGAHARSAGEETFPDIIIDEAAITVGKIKGKCDVRLNSQTVSRVHARLEFKEGEYYVKDLNSRNGTFLNGERLHPHEQRLFEDGDRIAFAEVEYRAVYFTRNQ